MGRFRWHCLNITYHVPYILRNGEKIGAAKMLDKISAPFLLNINHDLYYNYTNIPCCYITESERRLLNAINAVHCDYQFGKAAFTAEDVIIR